jgi:hypothetical protein
VAREIGADPAFVIAATHGKRAIDNLRRFKPHLRSHEMEAAVEEFERSILLYADAYARRRIAAPSLLSDSDTDTDSLTGSGASSGSSLVDNNSSVSSLVPSAVASAEQLVAAPPGELADELADELAAALSIANVRRSNEWELELEAAEVDRGVRILPGVRALLESIPEGRYAVATSGAKAYGASRSQTLPRGFGRLG